MTRRHLCMIHVLTTTFALAASACGHGQGGGAPGPLERLSVSATSITAGYAVGLLRSSKEVGAFEISKEPIRVVDYKQCMAAGACTAPALETRACEGLRPDRAAAQHRNFAPGTDALPVLCATPAQAAAYCTWQKGSLPTETQWLLAARGPNVQRWAWGDAPPSCAQHPFSTSPACKHSEGDPVQLLTTGTHHAGDSVRGLSDVLLTQAELVRTTADSPTATCAMSTDGYACLVTSLTPGAIDGARRIEETPSAGAYYPDFSFRCVWTKG